MTAILSAYLVVSALLAGMFHIGISITDLSDYHKTDESPGGGARAFVI